MDDRKAIREARRNNLTVFTTLAVLELAAIKNFIDLASVPDELAQTSLRLPRDDIMDEYRRRDKDRKSDG